VRALTTHQQLPFSGDSNCPMTDIIHCPKPAIHQIPLPTHSCPSRSSALRTRSDKSGHWETVFLLWVSRRECHPATIQGLYRLGCWPAQAKTDRAKPNRRRHARQAIFVSPRTLGGNIRDAQSVHRMRSAPIGERFGIFPEDIHVLLGLG
jgi:hypothetical protein